MFTDTPAPYGAMKAPSRDESEGKGRPYVHQSYPSMRFHPDGRAQAVKDAHEDRALSEPWAAKPYPPVPLVIPPPEPTIAELRVSNLKLAAEIEALTKELAGARARDADLQAKILELQAEAMDTHSRKTFGRARNKE